MAHEHAHGTSERRTGNRRRLAIVLVLVGGHTVAEVAGGIITNSLVEYRISQYPEALGARLKSLDLALPRHC